MRGRRSGAHYPRDVRGMERWQRASRPKLAIELVTGTSSRCSRCRHEATAEPRKAVFGRRRQERRRPPAPARATAAYVPPERRHSKEGPPRLSERIWNLASERIRKKWKVVAEKVESENFPGPFSSRFSGSYGAPGKIRTPNLLIRSQMLYPVELRPHGVASRGGPACGAGSPWRRGGEV